MTSDAKELKTLLETVDGIRIPHLRQDAVVVAARLWPEERPDQLLEDAEDHDWICFHDVITAVVDIDHFIVLFYGYHGYWG